MDQAEPRVGLLDALIAHEHDAPRLFVLRQQPPSIPGLLAGLKRLDELVYDAQLRDPPAFLRAKYPDPLPAIDSALFKSTLEAAITGDTARARILLAELALTDLMSLGSLIGRLKLAISDLDAGRLRTTVTESIAEHQGTLPL